MGSLTSWLQRRSIGRVQNVGGSLIRDPVKRRMDTGGEDTLSSIGQANVKRRYERELKKQATAVLRNKMKSDDDQGNDHAPVDKAELKKLMDSMRKAEQDRQKGGRLSAEDISRVVQLVSEKMSKANDAKKEDADKQAAADAFVDKQAAVDAEMNAKADKRLEEAKVKQPAFDLDDVVSEVITQLGGRLLPEATILGQMAYSDGSKWVILPKSSLSSDAYLAQTPAGVLSWRS